MQIWITTDTHLGHNKMIEYCGRPENHSELILQGLKNNVKEGDVLIHLGDICIGHDEQWHYDLLGYLPPNVLRILIKGNHDKNSTNWYLNHGWNMVFGETGEITQFFGKRIWFSHEPRAKNGEADVNIHGHWHNNAHRIDEETKRWYNKGYNKLLAIENTDYKPVNLESLL